MWVFSAFLNADKVPQRSTGEVPPHEKTGHQNWPASYAECRANVVQMNACVLDSVSLAGLPDTTYSAQSSISIVRNRMKKIERVRICSIH